RFSLEGYDWLKKTVQGENAEEKLEVIRKLAGLADALGLSMPRLALSWCLSNRRISTTILGASKVSQLEENLQAIDDYKKLTPEILERIDDIAGTKPEPEPTF
ncbi:MAG: aldo/keto reductase, partial [Verrucomicrobiota bacterium]